MRSTLVKNRLRIAATLPAAVIAALVAGPATAAPTGDAPTAASSSVVISEVYGGGGNSGAPYTNDFVELHNPGSADVDVSGWSVQYASSSGTFNQLTELSGSIPAGGTYLVQEAAGAGSGEPLPQPDASGSISMSASHGKVALAQGSSKLACGDSCAGADGVADFVGYGDANDFEGSGAAPTISNSTSDARDGDYADTDDNAADFAEGAPTPANCSSTGTCPPSVSASIASVQGAAHISPMKGEDVTGVTGVVTARKSTGFWIQDPRGDQAPGYVQGASSGVFVFTSSAPTGDLVPGTAVSVDATVSEYRPGSDGLTITELSNPDVSVVSTDQPLPAPTVVGGIGRPVPSTVIDDDAGDGPPINVETEGSYDPVHDGIDFWESMEGMRVEIDDARVVGPTNTSYGETPIVPAVAGTETARGGIVLLPDDPNPERVILDDSLGTFVPKANVGDTYTGATVGILGYDFNNFHLLATTRPTLHQGDIQREVTSPSAHDELSVATFNVENLDATDPQSKFDTLAQMLVDNLKSPQLVALEEIQDNDGATDSGTVAANVTLQKLVDAISAAGGPTYTWQQINPVNDQEGGEPGGNIRVAFLIRQGTPLAFVERNPGDSTTDTDVETVDGKPALTHSPGRVDPTNPAFDDSRVPLAGEFTFGGQKV
ncbi:MAG: lamin tail domain-containing protein, partial [Nocardioidaceae bacterium]